MKTEKMQKISLGSLGASVVFNCSTRKYLKQETEWFKDLPQFIQDYNKIVTLYNKIQYDIPSICKEMTTIVSQADKVSSGCCAFVRQRNITKTDELNGDKDLSKRRKAKQQRELEKQEKKSEKQKLSSARKLSHLNYFFTEGYPIDGSFERIKTCMNNVGKDIEELDKISKQFSNNYDNINLDFLHPEPLEDAREVVDNIKKSIGTMESHCKDKFARLNKKYKKISNEEQIERDKNDSTIDIDIVNRSINRAIESVKDLDVIHGIYQCGSCGQMVANAIVEIYYRNGNQEDYKNARSQLYIDPPKVANNQKQI